MSIITPADLTERITSLTPPSNACGLDPDVRARLVETVAQYLWFGRVLAQISLTATLRVTTTDSEEAAFVAALREVVASAGQEECPDTLSAQLILSKADLGPDERSAVARVIAGVLYTSDPREYIELLLDAVETGRGLDQLEASERGFLLATGQLLTVLWQYVSDCDELSTPEPTLQQLDELGPQRSILTEIHKYGQTRHATMPYGQLIRIMMHMYSFDRAFIVKCLTILEQKWAIIIHGGSSSATSSFPDKVELAPYYHRRLVAG